MAYRVATVVLLAAGGCHDLFALDALPDAAGPACFMLDPGADDDGDGEINSIDVCPRVPHDEDQDGIPDACDLCPQFVDAGDDRDCDGLGAACDPDDSVPHTIEFHGFGSQRGIRILEGFTVDSDDLHAVLDNSFAEAIVLASVPADGLYEGSFTVSGM